MPETIGGGYVHIITVNRYSLQINTISVMVAPFVSGYLADITAITDNFTSRSELFARGRSPLLIRGKTGGNPGGKYGRNRGKCVEYR